METQRLKSILNDPRVDKIKVCIALSSPGEDPELIFEEDFNDCVLRSDGTLEIWHNKGWEI